jgi:hypothetical protein
MAGYGPRSIDRGSNDLRGGAGMKKKWIAFTAADSEWEEFYLLAP